jgi:hypothetical protein
MTPRPLAALAALGFFAALLVHCGFRDVVVADLPAVPTGGDGDGDEDDTSSCTKNSDCTPTQYCSHPCTEASGHCRKRPTHCDDDGPSVCGCDGITYWSDCVRAEHGTAGSTAGQCTNPVACNAANACPAGATCAYLVGDDNACTNVTVGSCWATPDACPTDLTATWAACSGGTGCVDLCTALTSGAAYRHAGSAACQ